MELRMEAWQPSEAQAAQGSASKWGNKSANDHHASLVVARSTSCISRSSPSCEFRCAGIVE